MNKERSIYRIEWLRNVFWVGMRRIIGREKFRRSTYYGVKIGDFADANKRIKEGLLADKPFLACRFGDGELRTTVYALENKLGIREGFPNYIKEKMSINAGFFPSDDKHLMQFGELMLNSCKQIDVIGVWYNLLEDYIIHNYAPDAHCVELDGLAPYLSEKPWSAALRGKKVLVIHPFEDSIKQQYKKRKFLFPGTDILPDFELYTLKAVQTAAGEISKFNDWFEALNYMFSEAMKINFEIAIIGCGAYGFPLAAKLKESGKKVVHLGGATQILFGVRGARWDSRPEMQKYFNEYWVRPSELEKPKNADRVEGACYW